MWTESNCNSCRKTLLNDNDLSVKKLESSQKIENQQCFLVKRLGLLHRMLGEIVDQLNQCFALQARSDFFLIGSKKNVYSPLQVMLNFGRTFAFTILSTYNLYKDVTSKNDHLKSCSLIHLSWSIYSNIFVICVIATGSYATRTVIFIRFDSYKVDSILKGIYFRENQQPSSFIKS